MALIPLPSTVEPAGGDYLVTPATAVRVPAGNDQLLRIGRFLSDLIGIAAGPEPPRVEPGGASGAAGAIHLELGDVPEAGDEAYELTVTPDRVTIRGRTAAGVFYGVQTLRQLMPAFVEHEAVRRHKDRPVRVPAGRIADSPRFGWRGAMLDVARHFMSVDDVNRYIDLLALHKLNRLHLHLADDQGWRIEIRSWPNLAAHGGSTEVGGGPGGFYTQQQYSDIAAYARDRFITIVPEIDMPGHTNAALASYAELNCKGVAPPLYTGIEVGFSALCVEMDFTYKFIDDVVREIAALTPGDYFHIGGDEVKTLTAPQYIQFIERVQTIVRSHGKRMIGWDEIAPAALSPTSIVQHWRPKTTPAEAVGKGAKVIMSLADRVYLDMKYDAATPIGLTWAALIDVQRAYDWDPAAVAAGVPESALLGVEAPLWTETAGNIRDVEYLAFPRLAAIAEVAWSRADRRRWEDFRTRLGAQAPRWSALGINFYRSPEIPWDPH
ncbi:MAG: beta-N-acetylhexosaminidase [Vicinamibacterales bacterium]